MDQKREVPLFRAMRPTAHEADYGANSAALSRLSYWLEEHKPKLTISYAGRLSWGLVLRELQKLMPPPKHQADWEHCCHFLEEDLKTRIEADTLSTAYLELRP